MRENLTKYIGENLDIFWQKISQKIFQQKNLLDILTKKIAKKLDKKLNKEYFDKKFGKTYFIKKFAKKFDIIFWGKIWQNILTKILTYFDKKFGKKYYNKKIDKIFLQKMAKYFDKKIYILIKLRREMGSMKKEGGLHPITVWWVTDAPTV